MAAKSRLTVFLVLLIETIYNHIYVKQAVFMVWEAHGA